MTTEEVLAQMCELLAAHFEGEVTVRPTDPDLDRYEFRLNGKICLRACVADHEEYVFVETGDIQKLPFDLPPNFKEKKTTRRLYRYEVR